MRSAAIKILFVLFAAVLFTAVSCTSNETGVPEGMKKVESTDKLSFNLFLPETWIQDLSTGVVSAYYGLKDMSNISVETFSVDDYDKTLDGYVDEYIEGLKTTFSTFELPEDGRSDVLFGGVAAKKIEYTASLTGKEYKFMQLITVYKGYMYIFTYTSQADAYESHLGDVQQMIDNFSFN